MNAGDTSRPQLKIRRVNLDTGRENVAVISRRSKALRAEVFRGFSRVELRRNSRVVLATLLITDDDTLVGPDDLGLAEPAFRRFAEPVGTLVTVTPAAPPNSLDAVRAKIQGRTLSASDIGAVVDDLVHYRYSDMEIAAFLISSASFMTSDELLALVHAMAQAGTQLTWNRSIVVDKHCIGGIPGNRTSMTADCGGPRTYDSQDFVACNYLPCRHSGHDGGAGASRSRGRRDAIIYIPFDQPNDKLLTVLFAAEALRRDGAERLVLVAPYLCYMRQDAAFQKGEAVSQRVIGGLLAGIVDRVITVDAHLHRTSDLQSVFPHIEADNLSAVPAIADALRGAGLDLETIIVGPDEESRPWVSDLADRLGVVHAVAQKLRRSDRSVEIGFADPKVFADHPVLLVDDIVSSGGTLMACAKALAAADAKTIDVIITHALFPAEMACEFVRAGVRSIRSTNSVPHPTNAIVLDDIFVAALRNEMSSTGRPERTS